MTRRSALGAAFALAACGRSRDADTVSMWAMSTEGENAPALLPPFTRATGIAVDLQSIPWTAAHDKLLTAYAGGSLPDVMMLNDGWLREFRAIGALSPLPPARRALLDDLFPAVGDQMTIAGRAWGVPWVVGTQAQFYRRDMLAAAGHPTPPADWAGWVAMLREVKRRNRDGYALLMLLNWPEHLMGFAAQQPDPLLRDRDGRGNFASPGFRHVLAFYKSLFDEGLAPAVASNEIGDPLALFARGWFAVYPAPPYAVGDLTLPDRHIPRDIWATAPLPGPHGLADAVAAANALVVSATARDPDRAWALIGYLCEPAVQARFHSLTGDLPSRPSAWKLPGLAGDPVVATFAEQMTRTIPAPAVPEWERIQTAVQQVAERMVRGEFGVDEAARLMDRQTDAILAKRRWLLDRGRAT